MSDCIKRDALIEQFESNRSRITYGENVVAAIISRIKAQPAADIVTLEDHERMKRELNTEIEGLKKAKDIILARNFATNVCQETLIERAKAEAIKEFAERLLEAIREHHYLLSDHCNSRDYGMFTVGIEQAICETKKEMVGDTK